MGIEQVLDKVTIAGISIIVLLFVSVELVKRVFKLEDEKVIVVTVGLGVAYSYAAALANMYPVFATWFTPLAIGILAAAGASGVYSWTKKRAPPES